MNISWKNDTEHTKRKTHFNPKQNKSPAFHYYIRPDIKSVKVLVINQTKYYIILPHKVIPNVELIYCHHKVPKHVLKLSVLGCLLNGICAYGTL